MRDRHILQNELKSGGAQYWNRRALTQLLYLEEMNRGTAEWEGLLNTGTVLVYEAYRKRGAVCADTVADLERVLAAASSAAKSITVDCVAHAHIDMNWMWSFDETVSVTVDTLRTILRLMAEYPSLTFAQSQAAIYKILEEYAPELLPAIRDRIREGRWEVTASTWVETDKNMPNGESLTRHLLYTRRELKRLLELDDDAFLIDFEPDTFGHNAQVPEILAGGGVKYYYHCRGYEQRHLYRWRAQSGAEITVFRDPTWYIDTIDRDSFLYIPSFCRENGINRMLHVFGVGDHGGGPTRRDIERIIDMDSWPCMPRLRFGRFIDFFKYIESLELPVVTGELNFVFPGCYTSQSRIKKANRAAEAALFESEALNSFSALMGGHPYSVEAFSGAWKNILFNQFHDILPGTGVIDTREYAMGLFQQTMACAGTRLGASARSLSSMIDTARLPLSIEARAESTAESAGVGFGAPEFVYTSATSEGDDIRLYNVFNLTQTDREDCATLTVWDWHAGPERARVLDEDGRELPTQLLDKEPQRYWEHVYFRILVLCKVPAFGYRTLALAESEEILTYNVLRDTIREGERNLVLENELVRAEFDLETAALKSFVDKATGTEHIDAGRSGAMFRFIEEDDSTRMTAWRIGRYASVRPLAQSIKMLPWVSGDLRQSFSFEANFKSSTVNVTVSLDQKARTLRYDVKCRWREFGERDKTIPQLSFAAPLAFDCAEYICDCAFGLVRRPPLNHDVPAGSFVFAPSGHGGVMLWTDSKYGYRLAGNTLAVSLIRSSYDPDPAPECCDHSFAFGLALIADETPPKLAEAARTFCRPSISVAASTHSGELPVTGSFLRLADDRAVISAVKMSEDGENALIVRLYDVSGHPHDQAIRFARPPREAYYIDAHEQILADASPAIRENSVSASLAPYAVTAIRLVF